MDSDKTVDSSVKPDIVVDAKDIFSPIPLLRLKKELAVTNSGAVVQIDCTDIGSKTDIINWCQTSKNKYLGEKNIDLHTSYYIQKGSL